MKFTKKEIKIVGSVLAAVVFLGIFFGTGQKLLGADWTPFVTWWITLLLLGISFYPLTSCVFKQFTDGGYLFSKTIALAVSGWLMWALSSLHILKFNQTSCLVLVILCTVANYVLAYVVRARKKKQGAQLANPFTVLADKLPYMVWLELFFFVVFLLLTYLKCFNPDANGTEKFMDYGFMTSLMRADYMPPEDFWFSGTSLNYYYLGQYFATFLTKLSGVGAGYGYNLALMMTAAFCLTFVYALVNQIFYQYLKERKVKGFFAPLTMWLPHLAGLLSACAVTFAASCHYLVFYKIVPIVWDVLSLEGNAPNYWFPDATRYIGYHPETNDKTIHEFPSYSFILGDLHAHVINIMFVLTLIAILFAWLLYRRERMQAARKNIYLDVNIKEEMLHPAVLLIGFFIGIFHMTNFWDFPIYYVVSGAVILTSNAVICGFNKKTILLTAWHAGVILGIAEVTAALFTLRFDSMAGGIALCVNHTPWYQLFILWGLPLILVFTYLAMLIAEEGWNNKDTEETEHKKCGFFRFLENLKITDLFLLILGLCAAGLVLMPELVYVVDIYSGDFKRANTMFKLTYQAFILFGIVTGPLIIRHIFLPKKVKNCLWGLVALYLVVYNTGYFFTSAETWFGDVTNKEKYEGLDASAFIDTLLPEDAVVIDWLNENIDGTAVVVEAPGDSYTTYERMSVLTGLPTIIGWHTHEWLWKDDVAAVDARVEDVKTIYTCEDTDTALALLKKYDAEYLYVSKLEMEKYGSLNYEWLKSLGEVVLEVEPEYKYFEVFLVKINYE